MNRNPSLLVGSQGPPRALIIVPRVQKDVVCAVATVVAHVCVVVAVLLWRLTGRYEVGLGWVGRCWPLSAWDSVSRISPVTTWYRDDDICVPWYGLVCDENTCAFPWRGLVCYLSLRLCRLISA